MKKRLCALLLLAMTLCLSCAVANVENTVYPVDAERIVYNLPKGAVAKSISMEDGFLSVVIDSEKTDWEKLLLYGYDAGIGMVINQLGFKAPAGAATCLTTGMSYDPEYDSEAWVLEILNELTVYDEPRPRQEATNGADILRYLEDTNLVQPLETRNQAIVASWFNEDGSLLRHEMLRFEITYTDSSSLYQSLAKMPKERVLQTGIVMGEDTHWEYEALGNISGFSCTVTDGAVRNEIESVAAIGGYDRLYVLITAPAGANNSWTVASGMGGEQLWEDHVYLAGETVAGVTLTRPAFFMVQYHEEQAGANETTYIVEWRDENGDVADVSQLTMQTIVGDPLPTPYYTHWDPLPASRVFFMNTNLGSLPVGEKPGKAVDGVELSVPMDGWMHLGVDESNLPSGQQLVETDFTPFVLPPEGATHYKWNNSGGNNIFGSRSAEEFVEVQEEITGNREDAEAIPEDGIVRLMSLEPVFPYESNGMTVFLPIGLTGEYSGGVQTIFWYDSADPDAEPIKREFFVNTQDADRFARIEETPARTSAPTQHIELPVIVVTGDLANRSLTLVIELYPQTGEDAIYYELYLKGDSGERVSLGGQPCQLYLPYPEGMDQFSEDVEFVIKHYTDYTNDPDDLFVSQTFSEEDGSVERTESGLLITVSSLSPFVLSWGDGHDGPPMGDLCDPGTHDLFYEDHGGALEERCGKCEHFAVLLIETQDQFVVGEEVFIELLPVEGRWIGAEQHYEIPELQIMDEHGNVLDELPSEPGFYSAFVEEAGVRTFRDFMILAEGGGDDSCEDGHQLQYAAGDGMLEELCERCDHHAVLIIEMKDTFAEGERIDTHLINQGDTWIGETGGGKYPESGLFTADMKPLKHTPTAPGNYALVVWVDDAKVVHPFSIIGNQAAVPQTGDNSVPVALLACVAAAAIGMLLAIKRRKA